MKTIKLTYGNHRDNDVVFISFDKDAELIKQIKVLGYTRWSQTKRVWYALQRDFDLNVFFTTMKPFAFIDYSALSRKENPSKGEVEAVGTHPTLRHSAYEKEHGLAVSKSNITKIKIEVVDYKKILLRFPFSKEHIAKMKTIPYYFWNKEQKQWHFPYSQNILDVIQHYFKAFEYSIECKYLNTKGIDKKELKNYKNERKCPPEYLEKLKLKRYSENTIRTYTGSFTDFINYYKDKELQEINEADIKAYLLYLFEKRQVSTSYQNQVINAIKFYYEKVCHGKKLPYISIERPFREKQLPTVLSEEEVMKLIGAVTNLKHKAILLTIYSAGLRISELINLKIADIDSDRKVIVIKGAKGNKDRNSLLSEKLILILREYKQIHNKQKTDNTNQKDMVNITPTEFSVGAIQTLAVMAERRQKH